MEWVEGEDLSQRLARGAISLDEALAIVAQAAAALDAAHEAGVVHRDLKPANIRIKADGTVKVLDFGLATVKEPPGARSASASMAATMTNPDALSQPGMILGTAAYMSPEQARGIPVDKRADLWALGVVLFEVLTGHRLFEGATLSDTLALVLTKDPDWTRLPGTTPAPIRRLQRRCLERDRKRRMADAADARLEYRGRVDGARRGDGAAERPIGGRGEPPAVDRRTRCRGGNHRGDGDSHGAIFALNATTLAARDARGHRHARN